MELMKELKEAYDQLTAPFKNSTEIETEIQNQFAVPSTNATKTGAEPTTLMCGGVGSTPIGVTREEQFFWGRDPYELLPDPTIEKYRDEARVAWVKKADEELKIHLVGMGNLVISDDGTAEWIPNATPEDARRALDDIKKVFDEEV